jgi:hypothetical protein
MMVSQKQSAIAADQIENFNRARVRVAVVQQIRCASLVIYVEPDRPQQVSQSGSVMFRSTLSAANFLWRACHHTPSLERSSTDFAPLIQRLPHPRSRAHTTTYTNCGTRRETGVENRRCNFNTTPSEVHHSSCTVLLSQHERRPPAV